MAIQLEATRRVLEAAQGMVDYVSLRLWFAASACAVTGSLWMVLLAQRFAYRPVKRDLEDAGRD